MTRIFISYDRDDRPFTRELAGRLRRVYGDVWFDENLYGGEDWWREIQNQIARCDIFLYLLSEESARSVYCQREHAEAVRLGKEVLPVRITPLQEIPPHLRQIHYVDMANGGMTVENFTELTASIYQIASRSAAAQPERAAPAATRARQWLFRGILAAAIALLLVVLVVATMPAPPFQGQIAFAAGRANRQEVFILRGGLPGVINNLLGSNPAVAGDAQVSGGLSWSPDGGWFLFASARDGQPALYIMRPDGSQLRALPLALADPARPAWSPAGREIAFSALSPAGDRDIFLAELDVSQPDSPALDNLRPVASDPADDDYPAWSPDGTQIAFASRRTGSWDVFLVSRGDQNLRQFTATDSDEVAPAWSPDGTLLSFESNRVRPLGPGSLPGAVAANPNWDLYVAFVDGSGTIQYTRSPGDDVAAAWSPDGRHLAFVSDRNGEDELYLLDYNDRKLVTPLGVAAGPTAPIWRR